MYPFESIEIIKIRFEKLMQFVTNVVKIRLISSHFPNRSYQVIARNNDSVVESEVAKVLIGIPQGSILSPLLSNIFITDLLNVLNDSGQTILSYADDTNMLPKFWAN